MPAVPALTGFGVDELNVSLLLGGAVLLVAVLAVRLSERSGLPTLLLYLGLGVAIGEAGLGVRFDDAELSDDFRYFFASTQRLEVANLPREQAMRMIDAAVQRQLSGRRTSGRPS